MKKHQILWRVSSNFWKSGFVKYSLHIVEKCHIAVSLLKRKESHWVVKANKLVRWTMSVFAGFFILARQNTDIHRQQSFSPKSCLLLLRTHVYFTLRRSARTQKQMSIRHVRKILSFAEHHINCSVNNNDHAELCSFLKINKQIMLIIWCREQVKPGTPPGSYGTEGK